jgi:hypothetical protein
MRLVASMRTILHAFGAVDAHIDAAMPAPGDERLASPRAPASRWRVGARSRSGRRSHGVPDPEPGRRHIGPTPTQRLLDIVLPFTEYPSAIDRQHVLGSPFWREECDDRSEGFLFLARRILEDWSSGQNPKLASRIDPGASPKRLEPTPGEPISVSHGAKKLPDRNVRSWPEPGPERRETSGVRGRRYRGALIGNERRWTICSAGGEISREELDKEVAEADNRDTRQLRQVLGAHYPKYELMRAHFAETERGRKPFEPPTVDRRKQ